MKTFIVPQVPGAKRTSENRTYTHAVIARFDPEAYAADIPKKIQDLDNKTERSNFKYYLRVVTNGVGGTWADEAWCSLIDERQYEEAKAVLDRNGHTWEQWLASRRAYYLDYYSKGLAKRDRDFFVLGWSQSYANAQKSISSLTRGRYLKDVQVVEAFEKVKAAA